MNQRGAISLDAALGITAAACVALLVVKGMTPGINPIASLLLIPFFICFVSVVTHLLGDGLYYWDRASMRFVRYESEGRPIRTWLMFLFLLAASIVFVFFLFSLTP